MSKVPCYLAVAFLLFAVFEGIINMAYAIKIKILRKKIRELKFKYSDSPENKAERSRLREEMAKIKQKREFRKSRILILTLVAGIFALLWLALNP